MTKASRASRKRRKPWNRSYGFFARRRLRAGAVGAPSPFVQDAAGVMSNSLQQSRPAALGNRHQQHRQHARQGRPELPVSRLVAEEEGVAARGDGHTYEPPGKHGGLTGVTVEPGLPVRLARNLEIG